MNHKLDSRFNRFMLNHIESRIAWFRSEILKQDLDPDYIDDPGEGQ